MRTIERTASYLIKENCITKGERCLHAKKVTVIGMVYYCDKKMNRNVVLDFDNGGCPSAEVPVSNGRTYAVRKIEIKNKPETSGTIYEAPKD